MILSLENLTKKFSNLKAVNSLSLNIILGGNIDWIYSIFSILTGIVLIILSHIIFLKRDY